MILAQFEPYDDEPTPSPPIPAQTFEPPQPIPEQIPLDYGRRQSNSPMLPGAPGIKPRLLRHISSAAMKARIPAHVRKLRRHPQQYQQYVEYGRGIHGLGAAEQFGPADLTSLVQAGLAPASALPQAQTFLQKWGPTILMGLGAGLVGVGAVVSTMASAGQLGRSG